MLNGIAAGARVEVVSSCDFISCRPIGGGLPRGLPEGAQHDGGVDAIAGDGEGRSI